MTTMTKLKANVQANGVRACEYGGHTGLFVFESGAVLRGAALDRRGVKLEPATGTFEVDDRVIWLAERELAAGGQA